MPIRNRNLRDRFNQLNAQAIHYHSYETAFRLYSRDELTEKQVREFTRAQFDGLYEGLTPADVSPEWFHQVHVMAARMKLPKAEFLTPVLSLSHINALNQGYAWNQIKNLTAHDMVTMNNGLNRSQTIAMKKFGLERSVVDKPWFNKSTLKFLNKGDDVETALKKSETAYHFSRAKHPVAINLRLNYFEAGVWIASPEIRLLLIMSNNNRATAQRDFPSELCWYILTFLFPANVKIGHFLDKLRNPLTKVDGLPPADQQHAISNLKRFGVFRLPLPAAFDVVAPERIENSPAP